MIRVFVDTDVLLDVAFKRKPFFNTSKIIVGMVETNKIWGHISSNCVANLYYILRKAGGELKAREFILTIMDFMTIIPIYHHTIQEALASTFTDLEDAIQYLAALEHRCEYIITRNLVDYRSSKIPTMMPEDFIKIYRFLY